MHGVKIKKTKMTATEEREYKKSVEFVVKAVASEFDCYCPPFRRKLYLYLAAKAAKKRVLPEIAKEVKLDKNGIYSHCIKKYNELFGQIPAEGQLIVLAKLFNALGVEQAAYEKEIARDEAFNGLLDALAEWTTERVELLTKQIKDEGKILAAAS